MTKTAKNSLVRYFSTRDTRLLDAIASRALVEGLSVDDVSGKLRSYIGSFNKNCRESRIYAGYLFIFDISSCIGYILRYVNELAEWVKPELNAIGVYCDYDEVMHLDLPDIVPTSHSIKRMKQRLGIEHNIEEHLDNVKRYGLCTDELRGRLKSYMDKVERDSGRGISVLSCVLYEKGVYLLKGYTELITVYVLPESLWEEEVVLKCTKDRRILVR